MGSKSLLVIAKGVTRKRSIQIVVDTTDIQSECFFVGYDQLEVWESIEVRFEGVQNLQSKRFVAVLAGDDGEKWFCNVV